VLGVGVGVVRLPHTRQKKKNFKNFPETNSTISYIYSIVIAEMCGKGLEMGKWRSTEDRHTGAESLPEIRGFSGASPLSPRLSSQATRSQVTDPLAYLPITALKRPHTRLNKPLTQPLLSDIMSVSLPEGVHYLQLQHPRRSPS